MKIVLITLFVSFQSCPAWGDEVVKRVDLNLASQTAKTYSGQTYDLNAMFEATPRFKFVLDGYLLRRRYSDNTPISDALLAADGIAKLSAQNYVDVGLAAGTTANIFAKYTVAVTPHHTVGANDFGLLLKNSVYKNMRAGTISPSYYRSLSDASGAGVAAIVVRADNWISALQGQVIFSPSAAHAFRVVGAFGQTIEDAGVEAAFDSIALEYAYELSDHWRLKLSYSDYLSSIRHEQSVGVGLGLR